MCLKKGITVSAIKAAEKNAVLRDSEIILIGTIETSLTKVNFYSSEMRKKFKRMYPIFLT